MATTPEGRVKDIIKKWFAKHNIPRWMIIPSPMSGTGVSDFIAILPMGRFLAIEAKRPGGKKNVTVHQQKFLDTINANCGVGVVVDCQEDLDELEIQLKAMGVL